MDALLILHQLLNWLGEYRSRPHKAGTGLFSQGNHSSLPWLSPFLALHPLLPPPRSPPPISLLSPPLSFPPRFPLCSGPRVTAVGRCVRVEPALCGPSVWSPSAERLLTGWMGESTTVYFTFFRMPGLCPEFLLRTSSFDPSQLGCSLRLRCLPVWSPRLMALLSAGVILLSLCQDMWPWRSFFWDRAREVKQKFQDKWQSWCIFRNWESYYTKFGSN